MPKLRWLSLSSKKCNLFTFFFEQKNIHNRIFRLNVDKVVDNVHWNLVNVDNNWYHLDLTWDDPVTSNGTDVLEYDYFLITTTELEELESDQHNFDIKIYKEAS